MNEQAQNRLALVIKQMKATESVTEDLKQHNQPAWVEMMNNIRSRAEEIIISEIISSQNHQSA